MSNCYVVQLPDRAVIRVAGEVARDFLQGMVTNDINKASETTAIHAGLLAPQGKILFDFFVLAEGDGYLLAVINSLVEARSELLVFDAKQLTQLARVILPFRISEQVHGTWVSNEELPVKR